MAGPAVKPAAPRGASGHERRIYAHRGASAELPENTLPAFARALEAGATAIETDAHMTRDGVVVLHHDPTAQRMGLVPAAWRDTDLAVCKQWNVGASFRAADGTALAERFAVPTLEEALLAFPTTRFNIDLKQAQPSMVAAALAVLRRLRAEDRVTLASFRWRTQREVRRLGYAGETALASKEVAWAMIAPRAMLRRHARAATAAQIPPQSGPVRLATPSFIAKCHDLGMRVDIWTVNDAAQAMALFDLGVDGVMTDAPATLVPALRAAGYV